MKKQILYLSAIVTFMMASCSSEPTQDAQASKASSEPVVNHSEHTNPQLPVQASMQPAGIGEVSLPEGELPKELVCMVNNAYMGKKQFPVEHEGKMYYGCCEMCVKTIRQEHQVRVAVDPTTGKEVDKSMAYITLKPGGMNGEVLYFESEATYKAFQAKNQ
jgi:YHS domain-containing protein